MKTAPAFDPRRLDVAAFARAEGRLAGDWPLAAMPRLLQDALPPVAADESVVWSAQGAYKPVAGGEAEIRLRLHAQATLQMVCQRCLQPMTVALDVQPSLRFVGDEAQAEALDEDSDEDVLALSPALDLQPLVEDEMILALPLVPRHERCPQPLPMSAGEGEAPRQPFAALVSLRRDNGGDKPG